MRVQAHHFKYFFILLFFWIPAALIYAVVLGKLVESLARLLW